MCLEDPMYNTLTVVKVNTMFLKVAKTGDVECSQL